MLAKQLRADEEAEDLRRELALRWELALRLDLIRAILEGSPSSSWKEEMAEQALARHADEILKGFKQLMTRVLRRVSTRPGLQEHNWVPWIKGDRGGHVFEQILDYLIRKRTGLTGDEIEGMVSVVPRVRPPRLTVEFVAWMDGFTREWTFEKPSTDDDDDGDDESRGLDEDGGEAEAHGQIPCGKD